AGGALAGMSRRIPKATYVPLKLDGLLPDTGAALAKNSFLMGLNLRPGEASAVHAMMASGNMRVPDAAAVNMRQSFEGSRMASRLAATGTVAAIPTSTLRDFGRALLTYRKQRLPLAQGSNLTSASGGVGGDEIMSYNAGLAAVNAFEVNMTVSYFGWLN